jgi:hypothetical protein
MSNWLYGLLSEDLANHERGIRFCVQHRCKIMLAYHRKQYADCFTRLEAATRP